MRERWLSLDVLRGATVALMILVNNPGDFRHVYAPLEHAAWHGLTPTDVVFPFFLFAVGNALAIVMPGFDAAPPAHFWRRLVRRAALIFGLGLLIHAAPFVRWDADGHLVWRSVEQLRVMGVLQRIALAWAAAALIVRFAGPRGAVVAAGALLVGYWAACVAFGDRADPYSLTGWFGTAVDRALLGASHLYRGEGVPFDPEGLASTAPAVAQVLIGWWAGRRVVEAFGAVAPSQHACGRGAPAAAVIGLFETALAFAVVAYAWQFAMPINKKLWTSSYVLLTSALACAVLAALVWRLDVNLRAAPVPRWARACAAFGRNALAIFVLSSLVPRLLSIIRWPDGLDAAGRTRFVTPLGWLDARLAETIGGDPRLSSLAVALGHVAAYWALAAWLDRRAIVIRV